MRVLDAREVCERLAALGTPVLTVHEVAEMNTTGQHERLNNHAADAVAGLLTGGAVRLFAEDATLLAELPIGKFKPAVDGRADAGVLTGYGKADGEVAYFEAVDAGGLLVFGDVAEALAKEREPIRRDFKVSVQ